MAVAFSALPQMGLLPQQYPPPLLPKPGKDNVKLQKLLKRTAKKKASAQTSQSAAYFRSSLSPVNEASPDLEHSDHSTPPKTPETPFSLYSVQQPPRFTVRPLYQHVASPYPQRAAYGRAARFTPQTVVAPSFSFSQHVTAVSQYSAQLSGGLPEPAMQLAVSQVPEPEVKVPGADAKNTALSQLSQARVSFGPASEATPPQAKRSRPGPTPYQATGGPSLIRPLTVLTPLGRSKSPRPTFKATEPSRSPKPMFDVPQIRMYTASTSYYETSRTPPVYDSAGLTAIGSTVGQSKTSTEAKQYLAPTPLLASDPQRETPTSETKRGATPTTEIHDAVLTTAPEIQRVTPATDTKRVTPTAEIKRVTPTAEIKRVTPTAEIKRVTRIVEIKRVTPTAEIKRVTPTAEIKRVTPNVEIKRVTPTAEIKRVTPTAEIKRVTPNVEIKRVTPTAEIKRVTPTAEIKRVTPNVEIKRVTPTIEIKRVTPTAEIRAKTPNFELRTQAGRPKTPAYHITRAATPVFEISRPNPLLFAVSPITVESERSRTPKTMSEVTTVSVSQSVKTTEPEPTETALNGDIHLDKASAVASALPTTTKSEPDLTREKIRTAPADPQTLHQVPTPEPATLAVTSTGNQRPKTPTYEASRLMSSSPSYKRPKTPTYGTSPSGVSPVAFERPKTPTKSTQQSRSLYRGLTPAEYTAYGGIRTYSPAFGFSSSKTKMKEEGAKESQESTVEVQAVSDSSKEPPKHLDKPHLKEESLAPTQPVPNIIVTQVFTTSGTTPAQDTRVVSSRPAAELEKIVSEDKAMAKPIMQKRAEKPVNKVTKPTKQAPDVKHSRPKDDDQDSLKTVRKPLGKDKVESANQKSAAETKAVVSELKETPKPVSPAKTKEESSLAARATPTGSTKLSAADSTISQDKVGDRKSKPISPAKKEAGEPLPVAEPPLKVIQKPKGMKSKVSGWSRLKKHMVVEQEEPKFPEAGSQKEPAEQGQGGAEQVDEEPVDSAQDMSQTMGAAKSTKMWDAVLFQMFSTKENIMHQIELNKSDKEKEKEKEQKKETKDEPAEIPSFAYRLPVLLFSPKFDAKKLKEAASRPVTKISTVFEMGLIGRKGKEEEPKDFNRKARGFTAI